MSRMGKFCSVYLSDVEATMLEELKKKLSSTTYGKIAYNRIFCMAIRQLHEKEIKNQGSIKNEVL